MRLFATLPVGLIALAIALTAPLRARGDDDRRVPRPPVEDEQPRVPQPPVEADRSEPREAAGHVSLAGGVLAGDDAGTLAFRPLVRAEAAFNFAGPFAAGAFLQVAFAEDGRDDVPAFGAGVLLTLRPELPLLGFVPHLEITGGRFQLPSRAEGGIVDAWSAGVGGGIGATIIPGVSIEARVHHGWYFGMRTNSAVSESAWTFGGALTVDLF